MLKAPFFSFSEEGKCVILFFTQVKFVGEITTRDKIFFF